MTNEKKNRIRLEGSDIPIISNKRLEKVGEADQEERITFCLHLRIKPSSPPLPTFEKLTNALLNRYQRKRLSEEEFKRLYGADPADIERVKAFASHHNLEVVSSSLVQRCVYLNGKVKDISDAFSDIDDAFSLKHSQYEHRGKVFRSYSGQVSIPQELDGIVIGVLGLNDLPVAKGNKYGSFISDEWITDFRKKEKKKKAMFKLAPFFTPPQVARAYNFPTDVTGKGQTIGFIELGGGYLIDTFMEYFELLNTIESSLGSGSKVLKIPDINPVHCGGKGGYNLPLKEWLFDLEVCADIEVAGSIANDANLVVYFGKDLSECGFLNAIITAVTDFKNYPSIISISLGGRESDTSGMFRKCMNLWFQTAAVMNITVCAATGDMGSSGCDNPLTGPNDKKAHVYFPASSPWVLACGGTKLIAHPDKDSIENEVVWNDGKILGATGGGVSQFFSPPHYQKICGITPTSVNPGGKKGRGIPDVAGNSSILSGYIVKSNWSPLLPCGGTSLAAPLWAALTALLNEKLNIQLGFVNPLLYQIDKKSGAFSDITEGNNQNFPSVPGYSATPGWDACTGLGTPNGKKLYKAILQMLQKEKS